MSVVYSCEFHERKQKRTPSTHEDERALQEDIDEDRKSKHAEDTLKTHTYIYGRRQENEVTTDKHEITHTANGVVVDITSHHQQQYITV